jgi:hypothetical protein
MNEHSKPILHLRHSSPIPNVSSEPESNINTLTITLKSLRCKMTECSASIATLQVANERLEEAYSKLHTATLNLQAALRDAK